MKLHIFRNRHIKDEVQNIERGDCIYLEDSFSKKRWSIYFRVNDKYIDIKKNASKIKIINKNEINLNNNYVIYDIDKRLLSRLLSGPKYAHWQNAEIGSHLNFFRSPDIYERDLYFSTIYFHQ